MDEEFNVVRDRDGHKLLYSVKSNQDLGKGGSLRKRRLQGEFLYKTKMKEMPLIEREDKHHIFEKWQLLYSAGIRVVSFMRRTDRGTVVMPDIRADGSELYGKSLVFQANNTFQTELTQPRAPHPLDSVFLSIVQSPTELATIESVARVYAKKATRNNILLPGDDPFELIVHPDPEHRWDVICLDVEEASAVTALHRSHLEQDNQDGVQAFVRFITNPKLHSFLRSK